MSIVIAFLIFSFIVFIHELGHFYFARKGHIAVEEFAIGMGPKLFGFMRNGTEWTIRLLPIGGFCKMHGEDGEEEEDEDKEPRVLNGGAFYEKSVWVRIKAVFGGPLFNFILALVVSFIYIGVGDTLTTTINYVPEDLPAYEAGIESGDKLISIDGHRILNTMEARVFINVAGGEPVGVVVERLVDGEKEKLAFEVTPAALVDETLPVEDQEPYYLIGIGYETMEKTFLNIVKYGIQETLAWIQIVFYSLALLFTGEVSLTALSGPVAIVDQISSGYEASLVDGIKAVITNITFFIVLLSSNLGVMNLLPIPALDGGRLIFLLIEAVRGKPVAPDKEGFIHMIGFAFLMILMVFVLFNDLHRIFGL